MQIICIKTMTSAYTEQDEYHLVRQRETENENS